MTKRAIIALGSNINPRFDFMQQAVDSLRLMAGITVVAISSVYESEPQGENLSGDFLNACCVCDTLLKPRDLLDICQLIEKECNRNRDEEKTAENRNRTLDLDIIMYETLEIVEDNLILPYPNWDQRSFVIFPLMDILEDLTQPQRFLIEGVLDKCDFSLNNCRKYEKMLH